MTRFRLLSVILLLGLLAGGVAIARVARQAPDFTWTAADGSRRTLASLQGQPTLLLIAPSPRDRRFRSQLREMHAVYQRIAAQRLVTLAAFTAEPGRVDSDIPVILAEDGPRVAFLYEVPQGFAVAMIGADGNLEILSTRVLTGQRILDIINNSFSRQDYLRRP